MFKHTPVD